MELRRVSRLVGLMLIGLALSMLTAVPWALIQDTSHTVWAFMGSAGITMACGLSAWAVGRHATGTIYRREALLVVAISWLLLGVFGGLPYLLDGAFTHPADAYFEAISGFTTTGSTVLPEIEAISGGLHWWRGMTHWLGGMGIIVLFVAILPKLGVGGKLLFKTEVPGPITEGLRPKIRETSLALWWIYVSLTLVLTLLLWAVGPDAADVRARGLSPNAEMDLHNAFIHAFATMATGGFSTLNASVAGFGSPLIEWILTLFMFLAGVNFSLYFMVVRKEWRKALRDGELHVYAAISVVASLVVAVAILGTTGEGGWTESHASFFDTLRHGSFQVVAVMTTTGFGTDNFDLYPPLPRLLLIMLMFIGGMAGSTAGGLKVFRFVVAGKAMWRQIYLTFRPNVVSKVRINNQNISDDVVHGIVVFLMIGMVAFGLASLFMAALGLDIVTATSSVAATLFNIGPGLARVGPVESFAFIPPIGKAALSLCMILGRLEFYALLVLLVPDFWRR